MTIENRGTRNQYTATGGQTVFAYNFEIFDEADLAVYKNSTRLAIGSDYTVNGVGSDTGGAVTLIVGATAGDIMTLFRDADAERLTDYQNSGDFLAQEVNDDFDRIWAIIQQIQTDQDRSLKLTQLTTAPIPLSVDEPVASNLLRWKSDSSGIESIPVSSITPTGEVTTDYNRHVSNYAALRAIDTDEFVDGQVITVTNTGIAGDFVLRNSVAHGLTDNGGTLIVIDADWHAERLTDGKSYYIDWFEDGNMQVAIDALDAFGGGKLYGTSGATHTQTSTVIIKDNITVDLQGATLQFNLVGTVGFDYTCRLRNNAWVMNGKINVTSTGTVGVQGGIHACINIGPLDGDGGTVASPSVDNDVHGWGVKNMTLATDRAGKNAISIKGDVHNGYIGYIRMEDNASMSGIHADWGHVGVISSSDITGSRTNFDAGTAYTIHPHNITIEHVSIGELTGSSAHAIRLSGCYDIKVRNVEAEKITGTAGTTAGVYIHAGDVGFEFALAEEKKFAHLGLVIDSVEIKDSVESWGLFCDAYADNIAVEVAATGYVPLMPPINRSDILLRNIKAKSQSGASANDGIRIQQIRGGRLEDSQPKYQKNGILIEESCEDFTVYNCAPESNREDGIKAGNLTKKPVNIIIDRCRPRLNGTSGTFAGIYFDHIDDSKICNCVIGDFDSETDQDRGINLTSNCTGITVIENHVEDVSSTNQAYKNGDSTTAYAVLKSFKNNTWNSAKITTGVGGSNIITTDSTLSYNGAITTRTCRGQRASLSADRTPVAGSWQNGDIIYYDDGPSGGFYGTICDVSGSPGTWTRLTVA